MHFDVIAREKNDINLSCLSFICSSMKSPHLSFVLRAIKASNISRCTFWCLATQSSSVTSSDKYFVPSENPRMQRWLKEDTKIGLASTFQKYYLWFVANGGTVEINLYSLCRFNEISFDIPKIEKDARKRAENAVHTTDAFFCEWIQVENVKHRCAVRMVLRRDRCYPRLLQLWVN